MPDDCIFCKIAEGSAESIRVWEGEHAVAFMDIAPISAGHVLVIPRVHGRELSDLTEDQAADTFRMVYRVATALPKSGLRCEGYNVWQSNGGGAGQEVGHVHFHLLPRFVGDPLRIGIDPDRPKFTPDDLREMADSISEAMDGS
ncbi:MAG: HIT family protein [Candidatus Latescibacteria bacterium]|jgi:histidine triad (HIT) family protein|nr:HIT family protein [Candidatus Latescibacterota bacterium]